MHPPLVPAEPAAAGDGTLFSTIYNDVYHSAHGGLAQARHVFLDGNDLPARWLGVDRFVIFETGFGIGLNFLATWQAWRKSNSGGRLHFISVEKHPFRRADLAGALSAYPELALLADELLRQWPVLTPGFHRLHFDYGAINLTLLLGDAKALVAQLTAHIDAVFLDGFSPAKNPDLWSANLLTTITRHCRNEATLATWSVAGDLRRTLEAAGWNLERRPGFAGKRQMLTAVHIRPVTPAPTFRAPLPGQRHAIVIGAGLAGTAVCERLASRGWRVDIFERHAQPAEEASGNPAGILLPHLAKDDALAARLSRACYLYALRRYSEFEEINWAPCGVLQVARDANHEVVQRDTVQQLSLPGDFATYIEQDAAEMLLGQHVAQGGWWFPGGGWVSPRSVCSALLAACGDFVTRHFSTEVVALRRSADNWIALGDDGRVVASAPQLILANANAANQLLPQALPLIPIRGQISILPDNFQRDMTPQLRHVICRSGYITPPAAGKICVGASFDSGDADLQIRLADHVGNLQRLDELLPGAARGLDAAQLEGRVGLRTAAPDRLPLVGSLPDTQANCPREPTLDTLPRQKGIHVLLGLSARGMVWSPLAAELLACQLEGEPLPLERDLIRAVDPARFHLRALRRKRADL